MFIGILCHGDDHLKSKLKQRPVYNFYLYAEAISCGTSNLAGNKHTKQNNFLSFVFAYRPRICSYINTTQKQVCKHPKDANTYFLFASSTYGLIHVILMWIFNIFRCVFVHVLHATVFWIGTPLSKINVVILQEHRAFINNFCYKFFMR